MFHASKSALCYLFHEKIGLSFEYVRTMTMMDILFVQDFVQLCIEWFLCL